MNKETIVNSAFIVQSSVVRSLRLPLRSRIGTMVCQPTLIGEADIASITDNEMVKNPNA